jgi:signal transduction histidine kinase
VRTRFFSNVLAEITVGALILAWAGVGFARLREAAPARYAEAALLFAGLLGTSLLVFDLPQTKDGLAPALFYAPLPFLLWTAVRFGAAGTASAVALVTVATIWGAVHGLGPFAGRAPQDTARDMQLFLIAMAVPMLLLSVAYGERARAQGEAREQRRQLTHLSRVAVLGELSGGIAHELNQPLTAILSNAQAAQHFIAGKTIDQAALAEILEDIILADQRASAVIRRLHALFKRGETQFQPLDVNELVADVLGIANGDLVARSVAVESELAASLPAVDGDRVELQQVMLNLVMNACEAMSPATEPQERRLEIRTETKDGDVHISFVDTGPGLSPAQYGKLFEPFYTTKAQGLGLGLSISYAIVRTHRGRLWAAPAKSRRGAAFHITLPALARPR